MLPGVQRVWENEPSHSQVNSHVRIWTPTSTTEPLEHDCKGQNPLPQRFIYIIRKLLKRRCLKWARITHLDIWNTSYGQKKGRESNYQFDFRPLKVGNRLDFLAFRHGVTYCLKAFDEGIIFSLDFISIRSLHAKLCAFKIIGFLVVGISGLPHGSLRKKNHLDVAPVERHRVYYKGEGGASTKFGPWWVLCVRISRRSS